KGRAQVLPSSTASKENRRWPDFTCSTPRAPTSCGAWGETRRRPKRTNGPLRWHRPRPSAPTSPAAALRRARLHAVTDPATVVLVHGAWHGAWCWSEVVDRLDAQGVPSVALELPLTSLGD